MSGEGDAPFNIYAKQLLGMRQGYPLWHPEIERGRGIEVQVGDVGYVHEGTFIRFFNVTLDADHPDHEMFGVPDDYQQFTVNKFLLREPEGVIESHLCSRSVTSFGLEGSATISTTPVGAGMKFRCSDEQGAFVFMNVPADKTHLLAPHSLIRFIRQNIDRWHEYAQNKHDLEVTRDQIIFISGVTKTEDWGLGAFMSQAKGGEVAFTAQVPFFQGTFSVQSQRAQTGNIQHRAKPPPRADDASSIRSARPLIGRAEAGPSAPALGSTSELAPPPKRDQTLFIHYYKMKARWWRKRIMKAAAGPDERDPDRSGDGEDIAAALLIDDEDVVQEPSVDPAYDPVDFLLNYILDYPLEDGTEVQMAIASDIHIYALFDGEIPLDIKEQLEKMRPPVMFVDDNREVACLAVAEWAEELPEGDAGESKAAGKQKEDVDPSDNPQSPRDRPQEGESSDSKNEREDKDTRLAPGIQGENSIVFQDHTGGVTCVAFSPDGRYLASGSEDTTVILRDGTTGVVIQRLTEHNDGIWSLKFSPDSTRMCTGANDGIALVWDLENVQTISVVAVLDGHTGVVQTIDYSPDGQKIVTSSVDFSVRIWDAISGTLLHKLDDHEAVVMSAVFSPDGKWVASCGADYKVKLWDAETGALKHSLDVHTGVVWSLAFSPDSRRLVTGSDDMTSRIWRVETGEELVILHEHQGPVWCVAFSPNDGKYVLSASNDATIKVCDSYTSECVHAFDRHDTLVNSAVFSPDGRWIASSVGDNAVMVWNVQTGKNLPAMQGHLDKVTGLQFSPESDRLVSCSDDGTVRIWTLPEHVDSDGAPEGLAA